MDYNNRRFGWSLPPSVTLRDINEAMEPEVEDEEDDRPEWASQEDDD